MEVVLVSLDSRVKTIVCNTRIHPQKLYHLTIFIQYGLQLLPNIMPHDVIHFAFSLLYCIM